MEQQAMSQQCNNQTFDNMSKEDDKIDSANQPMGHKRSDKLPILGGLKDFNPFFANIPSTHPFFRLQWLKHKLVKFRRGAESQLSFPTHAFRIQLKYSIISLVGS